MNSHLDTLLRYAVTFFGAVVLKVMDQKTLVKRRGSYKHRAPTQSVCVADCYFIVNVLDLPFASPIAIYR